jgi:hypothetical protein
VTQADTGATAARFLQYKTPADLFNGSSTPRFDIANAKPHMLLLSPRLEKEPSPKSFDEFLQADSKGLLIDGSGHAVYYAQHVNDTFTKFVDEHQFRTIANILNAPDDLEFRVGSLELKSSWKILTEADVAAGHYFSADAQVSVLKIEQGVAKIDTTAPPMQVRVGLVGLHVVGVVQGHPEFIWATFEHLDNAPNVVSAQITPAGQDFTFFTKGTPLAECNKKAKLEWQDPGKQVFKNSTPICRQFPFGLEAGAVDANHPKAATEEDEAITALNKSVHDALDQAADPKLKIYKNYKLMGAVWLNRPEHFKPNEDFVSEDFTDPTKEILGGERALSSATMETFTQSKNLNCFTCHSTQEQRGNGVVFPPKKIGVSHILTNAVFFGTKRAQQPATAPAHP